MLRDIFRLLTSPKIHLNITACLSILADHVHLLWPHCARLLKPEILSTKTMRPLVRQRLPKRSDRIQSRRTSLRTLRHVCRSFFNTTSSLPSLVFSVTPALPHSFDSPGHLCHPQRAMPILPSCRLQSMNAHVNNTRVGVLVSVLG